MTTNLKSNIIFSWLFYLLFFSSSIHAQHSKIQSDIDYSSLSFQQLRDTSLSIYMKGKYQDLLQCGQYGRDKAKVEFGTQDSLYAIFTQTMGVSYMYLGKYELSESHFSEVKPIIETIFGKISSQYSEIIRNFGQLYFFQGKYELAEPYFVQALESAKKDKKSEYLFGLSDLANLYMELGKYEQAELLFSESRQKVKEDYGEEHFWYASALNGIGLFYSNMGKYEQAETALLQSIKIREKILDPLHPKYALAILNLGFLYRKTAHYEKALPLYQKALYIYEKSLGKEHREYANCLNNLAGLYNALEQYPEAEQLYKESLRIREKASNEPDAYVLAQLSLMYQKMDKLDSAYIYALTSLAINSTNFTLVFPGLFSKRLGAEFEFQVDKCCQELEPNDYLKLLELEHKSSKIIGELLDNLLKITKSQYKKLKTNPSLATQAAAKLQAHYNISKVAMQLNEQLCNEFSTSSDKLVVVSKKNWIVRAGIEAALEIGTPTSLTEAFSFAEQNKSVLLTDAVKGNRARDLGDLPDSLVFRKIELEAKKQSIKRKKYSLGINDNKTNVIALENELNNEVDAFLKHLKDNYPKYHALRYESITAKAKEVQQLLDEQTILLEYFVSDSKTYLFVLTKDSLSLIPILVDMDKLNLNIKALRRALSDYKFIKEEQSNAYNLLTNTAYWFYTTLLEPALKDKNHTRLIIVTDGELGHLPFEVFLTKNPTPISDDKVASPEIEVNYSTLSYLVRDYDISYNYSATLFVESQQGLKGKKSSSSEQSKTTAQTGNLLACASYYPNAEEWSRLDSSLSDFRLPHLLKLRKTLIPLDAAKAEVQALSTFFEGDFLLNDDANEAFFKQNASKYSVIHLAMHGILDSKLPALSSLAFTENGDSLEDNFLQAYEISHLHLNADLVVLSACETGYGQFEQGEGIISLARSFMYAGVPSLVVSLWQVNDYSTSIIMQCFYNNLSKGLPKDVALRQAKLDYLNMAEDIAAHPAFWSAFIQLGNSNPIEFKKSSIPSWCWAVGVGGVLVLVLGLMGFRKKRDLA